MYSITEGFSPILYCRPDLVTLGNPFDTMKRFCLYSQCSHLNLSFGVLGFRCLTESALLDCHVLKGFGIYMIGILDS